MSNISAENIKSIITSKIVLSSEQIESIKLSTKSINIVLSNLNQDKHDNINKTITTLLWQNFPDLKTNIIFTKNKNSCNKKTAPIKILIASCKGGVGKSTISALIAKILSQKYKIGILDADIYGPSIPTIFNNLEKVKISDSKFLPLTSEGIEFISMGNIIDNDRAAIWRGPMITKAIKQFFSHTKWDNRDFIIIDTPPGTGDVSLTIQKEQQIDAVMLVTTPSNLATEELIRSIDFYKKTNTPILGIIENMSYILDNKQNKLFPFGHNNYQEMLDKHMLKIITQLPLDSNIQNNLIAPKINEQDILSKIEDFIQIYKKST